MVEKNNGKSRGSHKEEEGRKGWGGGRDSSVYYRFAEPVIIARPRNAHRRPLILPLAILFSSLLIRPILGQFPRFFLVPVLSPVFVCSRASCGECPLPLYVWLRACVSSFRSLPRSADSIIIINLFPNHSPPGPPPPVVLSFILSLSPPGFFDLQPGPPGVSRFL